MTRLLFAALFAAPALFPSYHPLAVWIGLGSLCVGLAVMWKADGGLGHCEGWIRRDEMATEARWWLQNMQKARVA